MRDTWRARLLVRGQHAQDELDRIAAIVRGHLIELAPGARPGLVLIAQDRPEGLRAVFSPGLAKVAHACGAVPCDVPTRGGYDWPVVGDLAAYAALAVRLEDEPEDGL